MKYHINSLFFCLIVLFSYEGISQTQNYHSRSLKPDEKLIEFTTNRFTFPNLDVTPDKKHIIFDVLGDIYQVPIEGGTAKILLQDKNWKRAGKLSPDGKTLAYISDEAGDFQVWTYNLKTQEKQKYPVIELGHYPLYPYWSTMGDLLIPSPEGLQSFDIKTGKSKIIRPAKETERSIMHTVNQKMTIGKTGKKAFYQVNDTLWAFDFDQKADIPIGQYTEKRKPTFIRINSNVSKALYFSNDGENHMQLNLNSWDLKNNQTKKVVTLPEFGHNRTTLDYSFDFIDNQTVVLDKEGEIVRLNINTGEYSPIPIKVKVKKIITKPLHREPQYIKDSIITASVLRNPVTRSDLDTIYFSAFGKLHTYSKTTGKIKEVYPDQDRFEISPSLSPNGKYLAYTTWNDWNMGHLYIRKLKTGKESQITQNPGRYINPAWSPDGTKISFMADETEAKMSTKKLRPIGNTVDYNMDLHEVTTLKNNRIAENSLSDTIYRVQPLSQLPNRFYPIPVYAPDGNSIYLSMKKKNKDLAVYAQIDLNSKEIINEYPIPFQTDEVLLSPNGKHIAFIHDNQVWVDTFPFTTKLIFSPYAEFLNKKAFYNGGYVNEVVLPKAKSIYEIAPSYLSWQDNSTLTWGSAEEVYQYNISSEKTAKIADIKVQKKRAIPKTQYALTNARIITINKEDRIIESGTILIKNNRIKAIGASKEIIIPKNYKVFDLNGKTIIPGLVDVHAHYHIFGPFEILRQQNHEYIGNLAYGVTTIYDPSVNILDYREQAQMVETGNLLGPRILASGNIILSQPGAHEYDYTRLDNFKDALRLTKSIKKLKVHTPIKEYLVKNGQKREWLREAAKKEDLTITAHQGNLIRALSRIINGYTAIEHSINEFSLQNDIINLIGKSGIAYTPTFITRPGAGRIFITQTAKERHKLLSFNGKYIYNNDYTFAYGAAKNEKQQKTIESWNKSKIYWQNRVIKSLKKISETKSLLSIGGHGEPLTGIGTHWEIWLMAKEISNYRALQAATINGAKKIDLQEEIGSIEHGKLADLVVLNGNPLKNIFNTTDILYTVQNGNIYKADSMKQIYPKEKELKPWGWESPIVLKRIENIYSRP